MNRTQKIDSLKPAQRWLVWASICFVASLFLALVQYLSGDFNLVGLVVFFLLMTVSAIFGSWLRNRQPPHV